MNTDRLFNQIRMIRALILRDLKTIGWYMAFIPAFTACILLLCMWKLPFDKTTMSALTLLVSMAYSIFLSYEQAAMKDVKFPRAVSLLCAAPYSREIIVCSRYLTFLLIYLYTAISHLIFSVMFGLSGPLPMYMYAALLLLISVIFGIITPIRHRFGFGNTTYIQVILIMVVCFLTTPVLKLILPSVIPATQNGGFGISLLFLLLTALSLAASAYCSIRIFRRKELL